MNTIRESRPTAVNTIPNGWRWSVDGEDFLVDNEKKVGFQIIEAIHSDPLGTVLLSYLDDYEEIEHSHSELFMKLMAHAKELGISTRQKSWPKAPNALSRRINRLIPSLERVGVEVNRDRGEQRSLLFVNHEARRRRIDERSPVVGNLLNKARGYLLGGTETVEVLAEQFDIETKGAQSILNTLQRDGIAFQVRPGIWKIV